MGFRSFIKKIGKKVKKVLPYAAAALPFIPGVSSAVSGITNTVGGWLGSGSSAANPPASSDSQVHVTGQRLPVDWLGMAKDVVPAFMGWYGQQQTNSAQAAQAQKQMDFQAEQTGTSYQRGVADMKAAGLNPMLAYSQGGAASGSGAQAQMGNEIGAGVSTAVQAAMTRAQLQQLQASTELTFNQADKTVQDTKLSEADTILRNTQQKSESARVNQVQEQARELALRNYVNEQTQRSQIELASSSADLRRHEAAKENWLSQQAKHNTAERKAYGDFWSTKYGHAYPYLEKSGALANSAASVFHKFKPWSLGAN